VIPLIPYNGVLRPVIMLVSIGLTFLVLYKARHRRCYKRLLFVACIGYVGLLLYATFLSRNVAQTYSYRLEFLGSAKRAFSVEGGVWELFKGDFAAIQLNELRSLEAIAINLLLMVPMGFLIPMTFAVYGIEIRAWQVILFGSVLSITIEFVQLITRLGMFDIDDWVFNTIGVALGYLSYRRIFDDNNISMIK
jgi:glycopeptide antibiotics resistance protein